MTKICHPAALPPKPGPESGWTFSANQYGSYATPKKNSRKRGISFWTFPTPLLNGQSLFTFRKAYFAWVSKLWLAGTAFDKGSFESLAGSLPYTNTSGQYATQNAFSLFKHIVDSALMFQAMNHYLFVNPDFVSHGWQATSGDTEPAAAAITAAAWDGRDTWSITVSNYALNEPYGVEIYVTAPGILTANANTLFQVGWIEPYSLHAWDSDISYPALSQVLKTWPAGARCLFGCRILYNDPRFYLPAPVAMVPITIGA